MVSARRAMSAISELDLARFGGPTTPHEEDISAELAQSELCKPDPDRLMLIIANNGTGAINISTKSPVTLTRGLPIGAGNILVLSAFDDGALVGERFYVVAALASTPVTLVSVYRQRRGS